MTATGSVDETTLIPEVLRQAPQVRAVLDRYGLRGCGGRHGPAETLGHFARAHDVPLPRLLDEVRAAAAGAPTAGAPEPAGAADAIYRPFFKAGILVVLTLGAAWGAYLLLRIARDGSFTAAGLHEVNAHGHAQIFGWVGLFVMGFAYQALPRFRHTDLAYPHLALASLWLMLTGLVAHSLLHPLAGGNVGLVAVALAASGLEVAAVLIFAGVLVATWRRAGKPLAVYEWYVASAVAWFVAQAVYESAYLTATLLASGPDLVDLVATWQAPLRDLQIHGFALLMILGVSQRLLHPIYGLPAPDPRRAAWALPVLNAALLGEAAGLVLMRRLGHGWAGLWYGAALVLAGTTWWLVRSWHLYAPTRDGDRSLKFLRAAYAWLFVSLGMLALLPAYQFGLLAWLAPESPAARLGFSHAYYGAARHAITVGFVSLMIVGVAARVVPTLNGVDVRRLSPLWAPFVLINAGCALRVAGQVLTDLTAASFPVTGVSGVLEVTGLALWGVHLWRVMSGRVTTADPPLQPGESITASHRVGAVLDRYPHLLAVLVGRGFRPLENPLARRTFARRVTLEAACRLLGVDVQNLLSELNAQRLESPEAADRPACDCCQHGRTPAGSPRA
jgi:hypothetical protein